MESSTPAVDFSKESQKAGPSVIQSVDDPPPLTEGVHLPGSTVDESRKDHDTSGNGIETDPKIHEKDYHSGEALATRSYFQPSSYYGEASQPKAGSTKLDRSSSDLGVSLGSQKSHSHETQSAGSAIDSSSDSWFTDSQISASGDEDDIGEWSPAAQGRGAWRAWRAQGFIEYGGEAQEALTSNPYAVVLHDPQRADLQISLTSMREETEGRQNMIQRWLDGIGPDIADGNCVIASAFDGCVATYTVLVKVLRQDSTFAESGTCSQLFDEFRKFYDWNDFNSTRSGNLDKLVDQSSFLKVSVLDMVGQWANAILRSKYLPNVFALACLCQCATK
jgi:hypothetical protein